MTKITISTAPKWHPMRMLYAFAIQTGVIGIGVFADSPAMQWIGFLGIIGFVTVGIKSLSDRMEGVTIEKAREYLDAMERDQK